MSQIFLLTGENLYQIDEEKRRWVDGFIEKFGEENVTLLDPKGTKIRDILDAVSASPFIAEKRLVVLNGMPKLEKEDIGRIGDIIHPSTLLLVIEPKPDKRLSATKELLAVADVKTFPLIKGAKLTQWMQQLAQECGSQITSAEALYLVDHVGEDQMLLASEVKKIAMFAEGRPMTRADIDSLVMLSTEQAGWKLMDLIAAGKVEDALTFAKDLMLRGESPYALWSRMLWMVSQLAVVTACVQEGDTNPAHIAKSAGVPFPTARTLIPLAKKIDVVTLKDIVDQFIEADIALKTGGYRSTVDATDEITALIDSCIARVCVQ